MLNFEFDPTRSRSNHTKHGIDFVEAQALWADPCLIQIDAKTVDEPRSIAIGRIDSKIWTAVFTTRNGNLRIISVRRARNEEVVLYES